MQDTYQHELPVLIDRRQLKEFSKVVSSLVHGLPSSDLASVHDVD